MVGLECMTIGSVVKRLTLSRHTRRFLSSLGLHADCYSRTMYHFIVYHVILQINCYYKMSIDLILYGFQVLLKCNVVLTVRIYITQLKRFLQMTEASATVMNSLRAV